MLHPMKGRSDMTTKKIISNFLITLLIAMAFNALIYFFLGYEKALQFFGGYVIELSLSVDNLFLFLLIFSSFRIGPQYQERVLTYGIIGAVTLRLIFVVVGIAIVNKFKWLLYVFGLLLILSGIKVLFLKDENSSFENSGLIKLLKRFIPVTNRLYGERFFIKINNKLYATPLFAILFLIEGSDVIFALDSIPAIFAISIDPLIVYTSNILALIGLRNLYFLLQKLHSTFEYMKYGVGVILVFTGAKLGLSFKYHIPVDTSIIIILSILALSIIFSIIVNKFRLVRS